MTTGKTIALTIWTFVGKVMSLFFQTLFRFVIGFLPRSKHLLISWLHSPSAVILEPKKIKSVTVSSSICHVVIGTGCSDNLVSFVYKMDIQVLLLHSPAKGCGVGQKQPALLPK